mgnify:CR=1 FL=1
MRFICLLLALTVGAAGTALAQSKPASPGSQPVQEIVITIEDLERFAQAMLRIYALSNEITLRVAAKREDLMDLHGEFNARAMAVLDNWDFTIDRYNEIERSSQLIPNIRKELSKRIRKADERLQSLARTPQTLEDARRLLEGRVNYPITAKTMPWFASDSELEDLAKDRMGGNGMNPMSKFLPGSSLPGM